MKVFFSLILAIPLFVYSQNESKIRVMGEIRDARTGDPIPYVHARLQNTMIGCSANSDGKFSLILDKSFDNGFLIFSSIGYKRKTVKINEILKNNIITLTDTTIVLENIVVTSPNAEAVILAAAKHLDDNYAVKPFHLKGFYRTSYEENQHFVRLFEAAVIIADKGFHRAQGFQAMVEQYRKSNDYRQFKWKQGGNFLFSYLKKDNIRNRRFFLDKKLTTNYNYKLEEITELDGEEIYHIKISLKDTAEVSYNASAYVRGKDHSVLEVNDVTVVKRVKRYPLSDSLQLAFTGGTTRVKYVDVDGTLYLATSSALSRHDVFDGNGHAKGTLDMHEELIVFEIVPQEKKVSGKVKRQGDIYLADYPYDENFWQNFNMPVDTRLSRKIKGDLNEKEDLSEQFRKNSPAGK